MHLEHNIYERTARYTKRSQLHAKSKSELKNSNLHRRPGSATSPRKSQFVYNHHKQERIVGVRYYIGGH